MKEIQKVVSKRKRRLGRGIGSGRGKTAGRGTKGQKARGKIPANLPSSGLPTFKKLPQRRGLGNRSLHLKPRLISLSQLNIFKKNSVVDLEQLIKSNLISQKDTQGVKILADQGLTVPLIIKVSVSNKAKVEIEKIGGKVENA